MYVINHKKIFLSISILLIVIAVALVSILGLSFGIDFTGGSVEQISYPTGQIPSQQQIERAVQSVTTNKHFIVRQSGSNGYSIRTQFLSESDHQKLLGDLSFNNTYKTQEDSFSSIGPTIGSELRDKALVAIIIVVLAIILFIAFSFRKVSKPVSSWVYGLVAIGTLVHDVAVPIGVFVLLGHFVFAQVDILFITALLAIMGYSINDTIVVFDRIRENLQVNQDGHIVEPFEETVGRSLWQTMARSINTSFTTLLALLALYFFGGVTTHNFALTLIAGIIAGTYSSIFFASPMLVALNRNKKKNA